MANDLITTGNPFLRAAAQLRETGRIERPVAVAETRTRSTKRAILNFIPDEDTLMGMINNALSALSRGIRWDRGSILNLMI